MEVTNNDEKIREKEDELKKVNDRFVVAESELKELNGRHAQMLEDKNILQDQLQAETELCNEAEEVHYQYICFISIYIYIYIYIYICYNNLIYCCLIYIVIQYILLSNIYCYLIYIIV